MTAPAIEDLLRELTPQVLGALVRRHGQFEGCEDAVQEAVLAATVQWTAEGVPYNPRGWLVAVASRRLIDQMRSDHARRERESAMAADVVPEDVPDTDDTLILLFLCCHPALTAASQTALTLRAVGGQRRLPLAARVVAAHLVDEPPGRDRHQPAARVVRYSLGRPLNGGGGSDQLVEGARSGARHNARGARCSS